MPPSSSRLTTVPRRRAAMTSRRTSSLSSRRPRISSRMAPSRLRHSWRSSGERSPPVATMRCSMGRAVRPVCSSRNCRSLTCASWAACQSAASCSARMNSRVSRLARDEGRLQRVRDRTQLTLPTTPRLASSTKLPLQMTECTHQEPDSDPGEALPAPRRHDHHEGADGGDVPGGVAVASGAVRVELRRDGERQDHGDRECETRPSTPASAGSCDLSGQSTSSGRAGVEHHADDDGHRIRRDRQRHRRQQQVVQREQRGEPDGEPAGQLDVHEASSRISLATTAGRGSDRRPAQVDDRAGAGLGVDVGLTAGVGEALGDRDAHTEPFAGHGARVEPRPGVADLDGDALLRPVDR